MFQDIWLTVAVNSNWPNITQLDFSTLMDKMYIPDSKVTFGIIDTQFIASKTDSEKRNFKVFDQNGNDINRFEFFEAIIRVANCKFKQQGLTNSWAEALRMMIN